MKSNLDYDELEPHNRQYSKPVKLTDFRKMAQSWSPPLSLPLPPRMDTVKADLIKDGNLLGVKVTFTEFQPYRTNITKVVISSHAWL